MIYPMVCLLSLAFLGLEPAVGICQYSCQWRVSIVEAGRSLLGVEGSGKVAAHTNGSGTFNILAYPCLVTCPPEVLETFET